MRDDAEVTKSVYFPGWDRRVVGFFLPEKNRQRDDASSAGSGGVCGQNELINS